MMTINNNSLLYNNDFGTSKKKINIKIDAINDKKNSSHDS